MMVVKSGCEGGAGHRKVRSRTVLSGRRAPKRWADVRVDGAAQDALARITVRAFLRDGNGHDEAEIHLARKA